MGTLDELVFYCKTKKPIGAMLLLGDSGTGKTHLVQKELQDALQDSHVIVHVSLFGINNLEALHDAVRKKWISDLIPILSNQKDYDEEIAFGKSFIKAVNSVLKFIVPKASHIGDAISAVSSIMSDVVVLPVVEDIHSHTNKRVVLVFDDVDGSLLNPIGLLGTINDYCENRGFHTIIIGDLENMNELEQKNTDLVRMAMEKTIAYVTRYHPDFEKIIPQLIAQKTWKNEEYAKFLQEHEKSIIEVFGAETEIRDKKKPFSKCHNLRSLITALEGFFRIYHHMKEAGVTDIDPYLRSYLAFYLARRAGILKEGKTSYTFTEDELKSVYPNYVPENLLDSVRIWIQEGYWDAEQFKKELALVKKDNG